MSAEIRDGIRRKQVKANRKTKLRSHCQILGIPQKSSGATHPIPPTSEKQREKENHDSASLPCILQKTKVKNTLSESKNLGLQSLHLQRFPSNNQPTNPACLFSDTEKTQLLYPPTPWPLE